MNQPAHAVIPPGLSYSLVSGSEPLECAEVARLLTGAAAQAEVVEEADADDAEFALTLAERLSASADSGERGHTVVVLEPGAEVLEVGLILEHVLEQRESVLPRVNLRHVIAVSSVREVLRVLVGSPTAGPEGGSRGAESDLGSAGRLAGRLEFASVVVLTDLVDGASCAADAVGADAVGTAIDVVAALNPRALILPAHGVSRLRRARTLPVRGRAHSLAASMGWQQHLGGRTPARSRSGRMGAFVFRDPRPFHPGRLLEAVERDLVPDRVGRIVRSRGFVRLASRPDQVGSWATAGDVLDLEPTGMASWDPDSPIGQELVFLGLDLDEDALAAALSGALLTPAELVDGPVRWRALPDPFPEWLHHHH